MQIARVIGDVVTTIKDENLSGITLLVLQPLDPDGNAAGGTLVAVDARLDAPRAGRGRAALR